jgi:hypothetical protein
MTSSQAEKILQTPSKTNAKEITSLYIIRPLKSQTNLKEVSHIPRKRTHYFYHISQ